MWSWGYARLLLALFTLTGTPSIAGAQSQQNCGLFIQNSQVCMRTADDLACASLNTRINGEIPEFHCLVRDTASLQQCRAVSIASNTFLQLSPVKLTYTEIFFPGISSKDLLDEGRILQSCTRDLEFKRGR